MIVKVSDNIISPLGNTTEENFSAVFRGESRLKTHSYPGMKESFMASLFENRDITFEDLIIRSIENALEKCVIDIKSKDTVIIISSTKGNIQLLEKKSPNDNEIRLGYSAQQIANHFGNPNKPLVVSNACISGLAAQVLALRLLDSGEYKNAVVAGADIQSKFIVSGFQCLKAVSPKECRPFDEDRCGLNLGEAAATIVYTNQDVPLENRWIGYSGAVKNDAFHISGPSRTAEGCYRAIMECLKDYDTNKIAFINAHGTSTLYNDEMEAQGINRAGLQEISVNSLKGYYGHTMGAAGLLETIISMQAIDNGVCLATRGFEASGTSYRIKVSNKTETTDKKAFLKLMSGFGGCNAAMLFMKGDQL